MDLELIKNFAKECSKDNEPGHDFNHVLRVHDLALAIASDIKCDIELVEIIAYLHDVEDHKFENKYNLKDFLNTLNISNEYKEKIIYIINHLSFSKYPKLDDDFPVEGKIVSDADRIDAIGAIGIARAFSYGGSKNRSFKETIKHFDEKLLVLDQYLYYSKSKKIAKKRMKILKQFYDELLIELNS